ncbi:S8 family serine peptidase [Oxynema sp. CENA135]|uniref:S8 family serine peptidase n=1 Tax=Oxynema sp. CENA135 TaxID=984206 RepID=UPI00190CB896|nr:S8 family serine peptidase [Oxynema sp. CENA135]MBK4730121.1 S8 family serine peptidase [Oxynema sp. CENA135]
MSVELFDASYYLAFNPDLANAGLNTPQKLFDHFKNAGLREGRSFSPFVDLDIYRQANRDLVRAGLDNRELYEHLKKYGIEEGRTFSAIVDLDFYARKNPDLAAAFGDDRENLFEHLQKRAIAENRQFSQFLDLNFYLSANPDLNSTLGGDPKAAFNHLFANGLWEGRPYLPGDLGGLVGSRLVGADPAVRPELDAIDNEDYYKFSIDTFSDLSVSVEGDRAAAKLSLIRDRDGNGFLDEAEAETAILAESAPLSQIDRYAMAPGNYFVKVSQNDTPTAYQLKVSATPAQILSRPDLGGNTLATAFDFGNLVRPDAIDGFISRDDPQDFYSFFLDSPRDLRVRLEGLAGKVNLNLYRDGNNNGVLDNGEIVPTQADTQRVPVDFNGDGEIDAQEFFDSLRPADGTDPFPSAIRGTNLQAGRYFIGVSTLSEETGYRLHLESIPTGVPNGGAGNIFPVGFGAIGRLRDRHEHADFIGEVNPYDFYQLDVGELRQVSIKLDRLAQSANLILIHDINNDGGFDFQEFVVYPSPTETPTPQIDRLLSEGTYYIGVAQVRGDTPYFLTVESSEVDPPADGAGNQLASAHDIGVLTEDIQIKNDFLGQGDREDYYQFTLDSFRDVGLYLYDMTGNAHLYLIRDRNNNGQVDPDEIVDGSEASGAYQDQINRILAPGTYFVRLAQAQKETSYNLWLEAQPVGVDLNPAGDNLPEATDLGLLDRPIRQSGRIGLDNPADFYHFQIDTPRDLSVFLDRLSANADVQLIHDRNADGIAEADEVVARGVEGATTPEEIHFDNLGPGSYHLAVTPSAAEQSYYELSLVPQRYSRSFGYGIPNAAAAVAAAIGSEPFAPGPRLGTSGWAVDLVGATAAWERGYTGRGVTVAVIDGAIDYTHPDLDDNVWSNEDEIPGNGVDDDGNGFVDDVRGWNFFEGNNEVRDLNPLEGHASHVAGIIAGENNGVGMTGIAPNARVMAVRAIDPLVGGEDSVAAGIRYAVDNGAQVINLSLGGSAPIPSLQDALSYANDRGVVVVMSSGNDGLSRFSGGKRFSGPKYPADLATEYGLAVGAVDRDRAIADFSTRANTDLRDYVVAPGVDVYSSLTTSNFAFWEGTSMASPVVAGVAALILSANPNLTPVQVEQLITATADPNGIIETGSFESFL